MDWAYPLMPQTRDMRKKESTNPMMRLAAAAAARPVNIICPGWNRSPNRPLHICPMP